MQIQSWQHFEWQLSESWADTNLKIQLTLSISIRHLLKFQRWTWTQALIYIQIKVHYKSMQTFPENEPFFIWTHTKTAIFNNKCNNRPKISEIVGKNMYRSFHPFILLWHRQWRNVSLCHRQQNGTFWMMTKFANHISSRSHCSLTLIIFRLWSPSLQQNRLQCSAEIWELNIKSPDLNSSI